jgi:uncharacterized repeat protein (TIGR01451 family)
MTVDIQKAAEKWVATLLILALGLALAVLRGLLPAAVYALDAPTPLAPPNGATTTAASHPPLGIPDFAWQVVPGATQYRLQLSQDMSFSSKQEWTTSNIRFTPLDATGLADGVWYWRVRVEQPAPVSAYSEAQTFTKQWATPDNAPALLAPADGATLEFYAWPAFSWAPVMGAASYRFQIATSADGFAAPRYSQVTLAPAHQPAAKLPNGLYYWRVIPLDAAGRDGTPSTVRSFTANYDAPPELLAPADLATPTFTPTFRWKGVTGAQFYRLQYTTDPAFHAGIITVETRNTEYTPSSELANDVNTYWRVQVQSGSAVTRWSEIRQFRKQWYIQPELLTPVNNYQTVTEPFFSWSPVPVAGGYRFELHCVNNFPATSQCGWIVDVGNPYFTLRPQGPKWPAAGIWYWRVTPLDGSGGLGKPSLVSSFVYSPTATAPQLVAPLYYFPPSDLHAPYEDRTAALPIFTWHRAFIAALSPVAAYRVQVDDDPLFGSVEWTWDTVNLSAAPTTGQPFTPTQGVDYYWRVGALGGVGGTLVDDWSWSQRWRARIDLTVRLGAHDEARGVTPPVAALAAAAPTLLRPLHAAESVEAAPLLEWWPLAGATTYQVQISRNDEAHGFTGDIVVDETVPYPAFAPADRLLPGTYYWRVAADGGAWSLIWRFQVAGQSRWRYERLSGDTANRNTIATDPAGDMTDPTLDLTDLQVSQDRDYWYFGFHAAPATPGVVYALYLDLDHLDGSGADADAHGYAVATIAAHRPEYAIYVLGSSGVFTASDVLIYRWTGSAWAPPQRLFDINGGLYYSDTERYLELSIPSTAIGMEETTGSAALSLFTARHIGDTAQDTVPSDSAVVYGTLDVGSPATILSRFASVSERLTPAMPPTNLTGDPTLFPSVPPFFWQWPVEVFGSFYHGYQFQAALDAQFTTVAHDYYMAIALPGYAPASHATLDDILGDNSYYWRVRPVYDSQATRRGAWSAGSRFERAGFIAQNLGTSVTFATPTFAWDMVEGATGYDLEVDNDPGYGSPEISVTTTRNSYTPARTLEQGAYHWRVRARRRNNVANDWTATQTLDLALPSVAGLATVPAGEARRAPTFCWTPLLAMDNGTPVLAAHKYRLQASLDPTFSAAYETTDTEQPCWTPMKGYADGAYYWRVALIDGDGRLGAYSPAVTVTKQYTTPLLLSPVQGIALAETPTFEWEPVLGAARYKLEVSLYHTFSPAYESVTTANARYTPTRRYDMGKTYYWRVAMLDKDGRQGPFAERNVTVTYSDLQITKSGPALARPGQMITYTLTYRNTGQGPAEGAQLTDILPAGLIADGPTAWDLGHIEPAASGSRVLTATVNPTLPCGVTLVNLARISAGSPESDTTNNEGRASTIVACPDLSLIKSGPYTVQMGEPITYTLTYNNRGMVAAAGVQITDTLPAGLSANGPLAWELGTLAASASGRVTVTATVDTGLACGAALVNRARIWGASAEADLTNNAGQSTVVVVCPPQRTYLPMMVR